MALSRPPPSKSINLDHTIVSAKHLKNVNWKNGSLNPYVVFWVDPDRRLATKSDDSGSTKPIWNERFTLPLSHSLNDSFLSLQIFHSQPNDTPKPLVASLTLPLKDLHDLTDPTRIRKFTLTRPSGRPHGTILLKLGLLGRPIQTVDYATVSRDYRGYLPSSPPYSTYNSTYNSYGPYHETSYFGYYPGYYSGAPLPPPPSQPFLDRPMSYAAGPSGPSAPIDYSLYEKRAKMGMGIGTGLAVGAVAGALGGLALEEGMNYEEEKIVERVENAAARDDFTEYRGDY